MGEKLKQIEQSFVKEIAAQIPEDRSKNSSVTGAQAGEKEIYVALYQMDGDNLDKWGMTLNSIAMQGVSRPIYENEADVCGMIRAKEQKAKEAYAVLKIKASDIVNSPSPHLDRNGKILIYVKPGSLKPENILRFVHISGQYLWRQGRLTKLDLPSPIKEKPV
jgi:Dot/Icm secretion system protein IcmQ